MERFSWASVSQRSEYYDVIAAATIADLTQACGEMEHARVIHTLFWENYLGLSKQPWCGSAALCPSQLSNTCQSSLGDRQRLGEQHHLCVSPRVLSPQRALMKTDRKWGRMAWAGNDHIQIQESKEQKIDSSESRGWEWQENIQSIWGWDGKRLFFMKNTNNSTRNLQSGF